MAWPTAEELRLDEVAPPVGSCLFAALHPGSPLGGWDTYAGLDEFMARVNLEGARALAGTRRRGGTRGGHRGEVHPWQLTLALTHRPVLRAVRPVHRRGAPAAGGGP